MRKLLLIILLVIGFTYSQGLDTRVMYLIENYDFSEIDADTVDADYIRADYITILEGLTTAGAVFNLSTEEPSVVDGDKLGQIDFQAPLETGADAILVSASIWAESDATFAADNNRTSLVFATGASEVATEKMRLDYLGALTVTGGISGTTITGTDKISTLLITEQMRLSYDATNYATWTVEADGALTLVTVDAGAETEADINFNPDGFVGIKTAVPTVELDVTGAIKSSSTIMGVAITGTGKISTIVTTKQFELGYDATNLFDITLLDDGHTTFTTVDPDGAEADINIIADGNVGINTVAPSEALEVTGTVKASTGFSTGGDIITIATNNIGSLGTPFNLIYGDSIHANWFGGSDFELGESGSDITVNADTLKGAPVWDGNLNITGSLSVTGASTEYGGMYFANNSNATVIETANTPIAVRQLTTSAFLNGWTFDAGSTGGITAYADGGGGTVTVTSTAHALLDTAIISIRGTTNYNGVFQIDSIDVNTFKITDTWVADDGASDWDEGSQLIADANAAGDYNTDWTVSASEAGGAGSTFLICLYKNATPIDETISERKFPNNDIGVYNGFGKVSISAGDKIFFMVQSTGVNDITHSYGNIRIEKL